ncbi:5166_t:CDS:2 [Paraglomus brasilianum]|uniref:5166_t:CDS:1 n=1 Tax=Paraglomus brasilianum TaxID=144538 RepID=A0A9N8W7E3_9GLOM|nr:5166_t:CDS:2 [Paraglomus brasilianum]
MSSLVVAVVYVGGCLLVMSTFSYFWRRRKAGKFSLLSYYLARAQLEPWFPEHKTRDIYYALVNADPPASEIQRKSALLRRAMTDIVRAGKINSDKQALATLLQQGAVGDDLWTSLLAAEAELYNVELNDVVVEANKYKHGWGQTILQTAQEMDSYYEHSNSNTLHGFLDATSLSTTDADFIQ